MSAKTKARWLGAYDPPAHLVDVLERVVDEATDRHTNEDDETFISCRLCGDWEGHQEGCPLPALVAWLEVKS